MLSERPAAGPTAGSKSSPPPPGNAAVQPSHYWTWRLLSCGFTAEESAAIRGIRREALLDHALRAIEEGWPFRAEWCLSPELLAALEKLAGSEPYPPIRTLLPRLPPGTRFEEVDLFLRCAGCQEVIRVGFVRLDPIRTKLSGFNRI